MNDESGRAANEAQIRALIEARIEAIRAKDVSRATAMMATDALLFDVVNPLQYAGVEAVRQRLAEWFASFEGAIAHELKNVSVAASGDVAFSHSLNHVDGIKNDGQHIDMWWRATVCYRKVDDRWLITHEHASVPFDVASGKASLDLKP